MALQSFILTWLLIGWFSGNSLAQNGTIGVAQNRHMCPYPWKYEAQIDDSGTCFLAFNTVSSNWSEALRTCRQHNGFLLKAPSKLQFRLPAVLRREGFQVLWTGLHIHPRTGKLVWDEIEAIALQSTEFPFQSTSSFPPMKWSVGQPNISRGKCVFATLTEGFEVPLMHFSLQNCSQAYHFMCQRDPVLPEVEKGFQVGCFDDWYGGIYTDHCYLITNQSLTQSRAQDECRRIIHSGESAELVSPTSVFEEAYIVKMMENISSKHAEIGFWTGLKYNASARVFYWGNGSRVDTTKISRNALDWIEGRNCAIISPDGQNSWGWLWIPCNRQAFRICQLPKIKQSTKPKLVLSTATGEVSGRKNEYGGDVPVEVPKAQLKFEITNLTYGFKLVFHRNWEVVSRNESSELQGFYFYNTWELHPLKKKSTDRILVVHPDYLTFRCRLDISKLYTLDEIEVTKFNLFQDPTVLHRSFQTLVASLDSVSRHITEGTGWNSVELTLRHFSFLRPSSKEMMVHFNASVHLQNVQVDRLEAAILKNFTVAMKSGIRIEALKMELRNEDINQLVDSLEVLPTRKCVEIRHMSSLGLPVGLPGQTFTSPEICGDTGQPTFVAHCSGDFYDGLKWIIVNQTDCNNPRKPSVLEKLDDLEKMDVNADTAFSIADSLANISRNTENLVPEVIIKITTILERIVDQESVDTKAGGRVCLTIDNMMKVDPDMLMKPQVTDSTSTRLLQTLDKYTERALLGPTDNQRQTYRALALEMWNVQNNTEVNGIRYLQVTKPPTGASEKFDWFSNQTFKTTLASDDDDDDDDKDVEGVDVSISLPPSLILERLKASQMKGEKLRMSFIVQRLSVLFSGQPSSNDSTLSVESLVVSATLGSEKIENLTEDQQISAVFFVNQTEKGTPRCVFWDFALQGGKGEWSDEGCTLFNITGQEGYYECRCNHLTNFAVLIDYGGKIDDVHNTVLTVITIIGLSLSIIGLSLTVLTFLLFRKFRQGNNQKTLFNLALALLASWILFLVGIILSQENMHSHVGCLVIAVLLHYFLLAGFMWMLVEAVLQYLRFVKILGTYIPYFIIKASFIAWGVPLIPVIVVLSIDYNLYYRHESLNVTKFCWMDQYASYFAFLLPVGLIILVNLVVFVLIIWTICIRPKGLQTNQSKTKSSIISLQAGIACFVLLGLTWIFGYLAIENARLVFQYIFTVLNSFHGFFIFLFFTLREKKVRQQWRTLCCKEKERKKSYASEMYSNKHSGSDDTTSHSTSHTVVTSGGKFKQINSSGDSVERSKPTKESMSFMNNQDDH